MSTPHIYGIDAQGNLLWYTHLGRETGAFDWIGPKIVGTGWGSFEHVFSGGDGVIYAIEPPAAPGAPEGGEGGRLLWYRHTGREAGTFEWEGPKVVGTGWSGFEKVFSGPNGVLYAIEAPIEAGVTFEGLPIHARAGNLRWYRHLGRGDGTFRWDGPHQVGIGWSGFEHVFAGQDGVIYAVEMAKWAQVQAQGRLILGTPGHLRWYRHVGQLDGSFRWQGPTTAGNGWSGFAHICAGDNGVIYLAEMSEESEPGDLRWYRHLGRSNGSFRWEGPKKVGVGWDGLKTMFTAHETSTVDLHLAFCEYFDPPGTPKIGPKSYLVKGTRRNVALSWSLSGVVNGVNAGDMTSAATNAFAIWKKAAPALNFRQVSSGADITIGVANLGGPSGGLFKLGQTTPDGASITLTNNVGVAFVPVEPPGSSSQNSLLAVLAHEIGHALGLLHSSTPGSAMSPVGASVETLGLEDVQAIRALYSWRSQSSVAGIGTEASPAVCACGSRLVMAWRGIGDDDAVWTCRSDDGINWTPQHEIPGTGTTDGPTMAWDGVNLWLAIRGIDGDDGLYWATSGDFGDNWSSIAPIPGTGSLTAPCLANVPGGPILVWRGIDGDSGLFFSQWQGGWTSQSPIPNTGSADRPAACLGPDGTPRMVWRGIPDDDGLYTARLEGHNWQPQKRLTWVVTGNGNAGTLSNVAPGSSMGPSIASAAGLLFMVWQGVPGDHNIYFNMAAVGPGALPDTIEWSSQIAIEGIATSHRPSVTIFQGVPFLAWKGVEGDHNIWTTRQMA